MKYLFAAAFAASFGAAHADNLVVDGSFEAQPQAAGSWNVYRSLPGWTTTSGAGIELRNAVSGTAFDGSNFVELDSYDNSAMAQQVATFAGGVYALSFDYSARPGVGAASNVIEVLWNGAVVAAVTADGSGLDANDWHPYSYQLTGIGHDVLGFRAAGTNDSLGGSLDAVALSPVPEPSTMTMTLGGLVLVGLWLGKRRSRR